MKGYSAICAEQFNKKWQEKMDRFMARTKCKFNYPSCENVYIVANITLLLHFQVNVECISPVS